MSATVPVEHRTFGLDRRTIKPAILIAIVVLFYAVVIPFVDGQVDHDNPVPAGTTVVIGSDVSLVPPAGWEVTDRTALDEGTLEIHNSGIVVNAQVGPFSEGLDELLAFAETGVETDVVRHDQRSIVAADGTGGLEEHFDGLNTEGVIAVYSDGTLGVSIVVEGPEPMVTRHSKEIDQMIASVRFGAGS